MLACISTSQIGNKYSLERTVGKFENTSKTGEGSFTPMIHGGQGLQAIGFKLIYGVKPLRTNKKNNQASLQGQSLEWKEKLLGVKTKWNKKGQQGQWRKGPC